MVIPVSGPIVRSREYPGPAIEGGYRPSWYYRFSSHYRQKKPFNLPLPYSLDINEVIRVSAPFPQVARDYSFCDPPDLSQLDNVRNRCYSKLVDRLNDSSMWAVNIAEMNQAISSIVTRSVQLSRFTRKLNRFDFLGAAKELKLASFPKGVSKKKALANNWLEFHFGWEPLVQDIGAAIHVLTESTPKRKIQVSASDRRSYEDGGPLPSFNKFHHLVDTRCRMQVECTVTNPNLHLATQLGFTNPLAIAWELVPFSFVVDWFTNVGQVLGSMTDFAGVSTSGAFTTLYQVSDKTESGYGNWDQPPYRQPMSAHYRTVYLRRSPGIPAPVLAIRPWKGFSPIRGATAVALLLQQLHR